MRVQSDVALRLRRDLAGSVEAVAGEQAAYLEMRRELLRRGFGASLIDEQFDYMQAWTEQLAGMVPLELEAPGMPDAQGGECVTEEFEKASAGGKEPGEASALDAAPPTPPAMPDAVTVSPPQLPLEDAAPGLPETGYVVSLSRTDWRRLHRLGGCSRHPGVHYLRFELLGAGRPQPEDYDDYCRQCWKSGGPEDSSGGEESETEHELEDEPLLAEEPEGTGLPGADAVF